MTATAVFVALLWVAFTVSVKVHELLVGVLAVGLTTVFFAHLLRSEALNLTLRFRDVAQLWRLPGYILAGSWKITVLLFKDLAGDRAGSFYRVCGFKTSGHDPALIGRTALAVIYTTATPNFIVIGVDPAQSLMLFFQIEQTEVPEMTRALGAQ